MYRFEPVLRVLAVAVLMVPGILHVSNIPAFAWSIYTYGIVSAPLAAFAAPVLIATEFVLGAFLVLKVETRFAYYFLAGLLAFYAVAVTYPLLRGRNISCGCLGVYSPDISWTHVVVLATAASIAFATGLSLSAQIASKVAKSDGRGALQAERAYKNGKQG